MKTAEEILKDCKSQLSYLNARHGALFLTEVLIEDIDNFLNTSHHTLPSDEEIKESLMFNSALQYDNEREYALIGATWMRSIASARIAEMERELREAKQFISSVTEFAEGMKVLDGEALLVLKNTARRVLSDKPTQLPRK